MGEEIYTVYCQNCLRSDFCVNKEHGAFGCRVHKSLMASMSLSYWPMFMKGENK